MTDIPEDMCISDQTIYGNGYDPDKIVENLKVQARKLVSEVYDEFYSPGYLKRLLLGHLDYEKEVETAVKAILAERQRCAEVATSWAKTCQSCGQIEGEGVANDIAVCIVGGATP